MTSIRQYLRRAIGRSETATACACTAEPTLDDLRVDATACPGRGDLANEPACRRTVIDVLRRNPREEIRVIAGGCERWYTPAATELLGAAARFAERVVHHDERLADLATRRPVAAASEAANRAGPVAALVTATGLHTATDGIEDVSTALDAFEGPTISAARVRRTPPPSVRLRETYETDSTSVRIYDAPDQPVATYHLDPIEAPLDTAQYDILAAAAGHLASGHAGAGEHAHHAAVRAALPDDAKSGTINDLADVLRKHTAGYGVLEDLFADPAVGSVYANAPADDTVLRVIVDDEPMRTNVCLTDHGAASLASRIRATSGRPFSSAAPIVDASATDVGEADRVRVAGVTSPVSDGTAFAFRAGDSDTWRLPDLVSNDTIPADAAALLSLAVHRGKRILVAGPRGAGKTTLLAALLWELPPADRIVLLEDTPELPVDALQQADRDALALRTSTSTEGAAVEPAEALRAALRLGDGALVVGEVRGEEAAVLYEAMRVGANSSAVLGTIHGDGPESVEERVVNDLGVPRSSFAATDLVATVGHTEHGRRLVSIAEVTDAGFTTLYEHTGRGLEATHSIRRGNSELVACLATPNETYADVRHLLSEGADALRNASSHGDSARNTAGNPPQSPTANPARTPTSATSPTFPTEVGR